MTVCTYTSKNIDIQYVLIPVKQQCVYNSMYSYLYGSEMSPSISGRSLSASLQCVTMFVTVIGVVSEKSWMHTPEALAKHYITYNAKVRGRAASVESM